MSCLYCHDGKLKPEFWLGKNPWSEEENRYYVTVTSNTMLDQGFRTDIYPPDIVAQWVRDGGICMRNRFIPWSDIKEIVWSPYVDSVPLEKTDE